MKNQFQIGIALGHAHYAKILKKGSRWKSKNIPIYIREYLLIPYYITTIGDVEVLYVIQHPLNVGEKVSFLKFARALREPCQKHSQDSC